MTLFPTNVIVQKKKPFRPHPTVLTPDPGAMSFTIFVEGFMDIMTMHAFSFFPICVGAENKFFENLAFVPPMTP